MAANIATRPCLSSAARNQAKVSSDPKVARLQGSNGPTGGVFPGKSSSAPDRAELRAFCEEGAKAAAEPARMANVKDFMVKKV